jgi:RHS repeat-associated protein
MRIMQNQRLQEYTCPTILFCGNFDVNLHNFRARNYDDSIGMFYATDPAGSTTSPYGYARQNPVSFIDPTGMVDGNFEARKKAEEASAKYIDELNHQAQMRMYYYLRGLGGITSIRLNFVEGGYRTFFSDGTLFSVDADGTAHSIGDFGTGDENNSNSIYVGDVYRIYYDPNIISPNGTKGSNVWETEAVFKNMKIGHYIIDDPYISSDYGMRNGDMHYGVDIVNKIPREVNGKSVYSVSSGKVVKVVKHPDGNPGGVRVRIQSINGYQYNYFHLQENSNAHLRYGTEVESGDILGCVGNTGRSTNPHLHFEIWDSNNNKINPYIIYPELYGYPTK